MQKCRRCGKTTCDSCSVRDADNNQNRHCLLCEEFDKTAPMGRFSIHATPEKKTKEPMEREWKVQEVPNCNQCEASTQKCRTCSKTKCNSCLVPPDAENEENRQCLNCKKFDEVASKKIPHRTAAHQGPSSSFDINDALSDTGSERARSWLVLRSRPCLLL